MQPVCSQCRKANRSCVAAATPTSLVPTPQPYLRPEAWATIEVSLHQYFTASIANIASDEFNGEFWQRSVLQARTALPAIRHASNAVACLKWTRNPRANLNHTFKQTLEAESGRQYAASMKYIFDIIQSPSPSPEEKTTVLLASVFYYRYALDWENILAILAKSCVLIRHWKFWECLDSGPISTIASQVLYYFVKSERACQESLCETPSKPTDNSWLEAIHWLQKRPLASTIHASVEIEMLWNSARGIMENLPFQPSSSQIDAASTDRRALHACFKIWEKRFDALVPSVSPDHHIPIAVLGVRRALANLLFKINLEEFGTIWSETCWDRLEHGFAIVLGLIESVLTEVTDPASQAYRDITYTPFLYKSLTFIARFCRSSAVRRRAAGIVRMAIPSALARSYVTTKSLEVDYSPRVRILPVDHIIALEESAWACEGANSECSATTRCIRNKYVCNMHRVAQVYLSRGILHEFTFFTVADFLQGKPGRKLAMPATLIF